MDYFELYNGYKLPVIGYGTFPQREGLSENVPIAYKYGYRIVDTSDNYLNEQFVGEGLKRTEAVDITIVTKFSQPSRTVELEKCFNESLNKLNRGGKEVLYLLHWPFPYLWKRQWRKMEDLYIKGECAAIGVCNFDVGYLTELLKFCRVKPMINQFERHPLFQQQKLVELCQKESIQVMSYSPLARMDADLNQNPTLHKIASKYGKTVNQVILRWNIDTHCIPLPASSSEVHIRENVDVFDFKLTNSEVEEINNLDSNRRIRYNPRTRFDKHEQTRFLVERLRISNPIMKIFINFAKSIRRRFL